uniref:YbaK/aminoacyl-tRNA synthetase-associated domain-containing protein n=1 Tax=Opuntia streptacantha TaxID=393608 RepID=A0A7C9D8H4_OPUST
MGYTQEQLLARLKELEIDFTQYEHPVVLTVEAALKYVGHVKGAFAKNLFLKDKKQRFYIISALSDTKVDMKVLSQRLGLGKGGLRMAPEEALAEILQVPLGCVTPFALINESARDVSLLLDQGFRTQECCLFHPLSNDMSIALTTNGLDKFLKSIGRVPAYVNLEANPPVGKDQPPDLAAFVPSAAVVLPETSEKGTSAQAAAQNQQFTNSKSATIAAKTVKQNNEVKSDKGKAANAKEVKDKAEHAVPSPRSFANTQHFVDEVLDKASALILSEITKENHEEHGNQLGAVASENIRRRLSSELNNLAMIFKNTAYTEGYHASSLNQPHHF